MLVHGVTRPSLHMDHTLFTADEAAVRLGISRATLYDWLAQSDGSRFVLRGQSTTIDYFQGGRRGQGRIMLQRMEVDRLLELMRVTPKPVREPRTPKTIRELKHIKSKLGRPDDV